MLSEFVMHDGQKQYDAPFKLHEGGYRATSGDSAKGPTISVEHHETQLADVEAIIYAVDGAAQHY
jgi:vacuolar-type H+-ATPase catalytic subunit A/Vma1